MSLRTTGGTRINYRSRSAAVRRAVEGTRKHCRDESEKKTGIPRRKITVKI